jgi:hypothetical protein
MASRPFVAWWLAPTFHMLLLTTGAVKPRQLPGPFHKGTSDGAGRIQIGIAVGHFFITRIGYRVYT